METNQYSGDVGITKIARQFIDANNLRIPPSLFIILRFSGFFVLAFLVYLLICGFIDWRLPLTWFFLIGYLAYEIALNILRKLNPKFYDSKIFLTVRILINLIFITGFVFAFPKARNILAFLYLIPIFLTTITKLESKLAFYLIITGTALCFYLAGASPLVPEPLPVYQALVIMFILVAISFYIKAVYSKRLETPPGLFAIAQTLYKTLDLNKLATEIKKNIIWLSGADDVMIIVTDPDSGRYIFHDKQGFEFRNDASIIDIAKRFSNLTSGKPVLFDSRVDGASYHQTFGILFESVPRVIIVLPILNQRSRVLGFIFIGYRERKKPDRYLLRIIEQFTALAGKAIEIALNFRSLNLDNARSHKEAEILMNAATEEDIMTVLKEKSLQLSNAVEAVNIHKLDAVTNDLIPVSGIQRDDYSQKVYHQSGENKVPNTMMKLGEGIAGSALAYRDSILVENVNEHPWFWGNHSTNQITSLLAAPMIDPMSDELIGTISIHSSEANAFSTADEINLVLLAHQGANAISKFRAIDRWELHDSMLMRILAAATTFNSMLPTSEFYKKITDTAIQVLGFDTARIRLWDPEREEYTTVALSVANDYVEASHKGERIPKFIMDKFFDKKFKVGRSYFIPHDTHELHELIDNYFSVIEKPISAHAGWQKYDGLITPLHSPQDGQIMGVMTLDLPKHDVKPTRDTIEAIGGFAGIVEWAIELHRTHRELTESHETTMSFIKSISDILSQTIDSDVDLIGWMAVQIGAELLSAEGCSLHLVEGKNLRLAYSTHLASTQYMGREKPISSRPGAGLSAWVAATGQPILIKSGEHDKHPGWGGETEHLRFIKSEMSYSVLLMPVKNREGNIIGVITLENKLRFGSVVDFDEKDINTLGILGSQIGMALEIAGHYKTIRQWERKGLQDDLHELIGLYQSSVVLQLDVMRDWVAQAKIDKLSCMLPRMIKRARTTLVELKTIHTAVYSKYLELEFVKDSLATIIKSWLKRISREYEQALQIRLECPSSLSLPVEIRGSCMRIAACAISNAILHSGILKDERIKIDVLVEQQGDRIILQVSDNGIGVKPLSEGFGMKRMRDLMVRINEEPHYRADLKIEQTEPEHGIKVVLEITQYEHNNK